MSNKSLSFYDAEIRLVESHLVDRFKSVELKSAHGTYSHGYMYATVHFEVFGHMCIVTLGKCPTEGHKMSIMYRDVLVYSRGTPDKSYFIQDCDIGMEMFIERFDIKHGRK